MPAVPRAPVARGWLVGLAAGGVRGSSWPWRSPRDRPAAGGADRAVGYAADESNVDSDGPAHADAALVVENQLTEPIALSVGDTRPARSPPATRPAAGAVGATLEAHWAMVQPSTGERLLGGAVEGAIVAERVDGELRRVVDADAGGSRASRHGGESTPAERSAWR